MRLRVSEALGAEDFRPYMKACERSNRERGEDLGRCRIVAARGVAEPPHATTPRDNARRGAFSRKGHLQTETDALYLICQQAHGKGD